MPSAARECSTHPKKVVGPWLVPWKWDRLTQLVITVQWKVNNGPLPSCGDLAFRMDLAFLRDSEDSGVSELGKTLTQRNPWSFFWVSRQEDYCARRVICPTWPRLLRVRVTYKPNPSIQMARVVKMCWKKTKPVEFLCRLSMCPKPGVADQPRLLGF